MTERNDVEDAGGDIARIEAQIEALRESIERCRKFSLAAKLIIAAGAIWMVLVLLSAVPPIPETFFAALAAAIIGIVLLGSNATTWTETANALRTSEAMRAELIGQIEMRVVEETRRIH